MRWLVIGIGNTLRRDDGIGAWVAERVAERNLPGVTVRVVHQLTPELSVEISDHDRALFVDACRSAAEAGVFKIEPLRGTSRMGHAMQPSEVLALANRTIEAWIVAVAGCDFEFGEGLSEPGSLAAERAVQVVLERISQS